MTTIVRCFKDKKGTSFPLIAAITLSLVIVMCGVLEFFRLNIIAAGVKEALQDAVIISVNDNYANVYHGVREGYSGGYLPWHPEFEYSVDYGNVYGHMKRVLGVKLENGKYVKYSSGAVEYRLSGLKITVGNPPLAPTNPEEVPAFEIDTVMILEAPMRFAGMNLPDMRVTLKVQAGYTEVFSR